MRALGYYRVSSEEQARTGHSLAMQPERIRQWCELREIELVSLVPDEGVSAGTALDRRPGGRTLLRQMRGSGAEVLVVFRLDRLFRDAQHGLNFIRDELNPRGLQLQSISELIDTSTPIGRFMLTILLGQAEYERDTIRERTKATMDSLRKRGRVYGSTPYGCVAVGGQWDDRASRMTGQQLYRDPVTWAHRELVLQLRAAGSSLESIVGELEVRGIPAPAGGRRWSKHTVSRVVSTHEGLNHIPPLPADHETAVSEAANA